MSNTLLIMVIALCFSALFSGLEIAFVSSDKLRFEMDVERKTFSSKILKRFFHKPNVYISTMLVGNNIALVIYSTMMAKLIESLIPEGAIPNEFLMVLLETLVSTLIVIVVGEFLPKTIFRINANATLNLFAAPIFAIYILLYPISLFTTWLSKLLLRLFGVKINNDSADKAFSRIDLDYFLQSGLSSSESSGDQESEVRIFQNVLDFSSVKIRDCMVPRNEICAVDRSVSLAELKDLFVETGFSKILVYDTDLDHIIGYVHSSELFRHKDNWQNYIHTMPFVPETLMAQKLMRQFMTRKRSLAVVVDEFGGTAGIVSLEDIVEEILGEIEDEHDVDSPLAKETDDGYILAGRVEIEHANQRFGLDLPVSDEYMTVGGLILHSAKGFPKVNDKITIDGHCFRVLKMSQTRIELVELSKQK